MLLGWFPGPPNRVGYPAVYALMDEPLREAFGFPKPPPALRGAVESTLLDGHVWSPFFRRATVRTSAHIAGLAPTAGAGSSRSWGRLGKDRATSRDKTGRAAARVIVVTA